MNLEKKFFHMSMWQFVNGRAEKDGPMWTPVPAGQGTLFSRILPIRSRIWATSQLLRHTSSVLRLMHARART